MEIRVNGGTNQLVAKEGEVMGLPFTIWRISLSHPALNKVEQEAQAAVNCSSSESERLPVTVTVS